MTTHRVAVERDGRGWKVRIDGRTTLGALVARDLADVEPRCRKLIAEHSGEAPDDIELGIELRLPATIQDRLDVIRQHCERYLYRGAQIVTPYNIDEVDPTGAPFRRTDHDDRDSVGRVSELVTLT